MRGQAGPSRRQAREFTRIAVAALALSACASSPPAGVPASSGLERMGEQALREGRAAEARALFFQAMRGQDRPFLAWIGVARASIAVGDLQTAEIAIGQAMQTDPGSAASVDLVA